MPAGLDGNAGMREDQRANPVMYGKRGSGLLFPAAASSLGAPGSDGHLVWEAAGTMICGAARVAREPSAVSHLARSCQPSTVCG